MFKAKKSTLLKIITAASLLVVILAGAQIFAAGYLFDKNIDKVLARISAKTANLSLKYQPKEASLLSREGIISWEVKLPEGLLPSLDHVSGQIRFNMQMGFLKVTGSFEPQTGQGNFEEFFKSFDLEPVRYQGAFRLAALMPEASFAVKTSAFSIPFTAGSCYLGESSLLFEASSKNNITTEFNFAGFDCRGSEQYAGMDSFHARLEGLFIRLHPYLEDSRPYLDTVELGLKLFDADISTIFAIGFSPDEEVKDPTLREGLRVSDLSGRLSFTDPNDKGQGILNIDSSGDFAFAFPSRESGLPQEAYCLDNLQLSGMIDRLNLTQTVENILNIKDSSDFGLMLAGFSSPLRLRLANFSLSNNGNELRLAADSTLGLNPQGGISSVDLNLNFTAHEDFIHDFVREFSYENELNRARENRILVREGRNYVSELAITGGNVIINGERIENLHEGEDVIASED